MDIENFLERDKAVWACNLNELFKYKPKRKISIVNTNLDELSLLDKNFTFVVSFHPISPYTFDATDSTGSHFEQSFGVKCPSTFTSVDDPYYLNLDAFD